MSWADRAKHGGVAVVVAAVTGVVPILLQSGGPFPLLGVATIVCGILFGFLIFLRELKLDIKALDDPNDNPRANRLIADRRDRGH
jgi:hypothetical protein